MTAVFERLVEFDPVPIPLPPVDLRRTLGVGVVHWIEANLVHGPGDIQGERVHLDDEEVAFILRAYAIDANGKRLVRRGVYSRPKGRAKSEMGAFLCSAELLGPVRFSHFDAGGYPIGKTVTAPVIKCVATEEDQADNVYGAVVYMLREGPLRAMPGLDVGLTRVYAPGGGKIMPVSARASSKDGGKETFVAFDEPHLYITRELRSLHQVLRRNLTKRKAAEPWALEMSTMYAPGENSVMEGAHRHALAIAAGEVVDDGFLFDHRQGPALAKDADDQEIRDALRLAYGAAAGWQDFDRKVADFRDPQTDWNDNVRYFLNAPVERTVGKWIADEEWRAAENAERVIPYMAEVVVGIDAAHSRDTTALVWTWLDPESGRLVQRARVWSCIAGKPHHAFSAGGRLDNDVVRDYILDTLADDFTIVLILGDERYFGDQLHELSEAGYTTVEVKQGSTDMLDAWSEFYGHVKSGATPKLEHDGDPIYAQHVSHAVGSKTESGWKVSKKTATSPIDAVAAGAMSAYGAEHRAEFAPDVSPWGPAAGTATR